VILMARLLGFCLAALVLTGVILYGLFIPHERMSLNTQWLLFLIALCDILVMIYLLPDSGIRSR